jgi:hypothetical protein
MRKAILPGGVYLLHHLLRLFLRKAAYSILCTEKSTGSAICLCVTQFIWDIIKAAGVTDFMRSFVNTEIKCPNVHCCHLTAKHFQPGSDIVF